MNGNQRFGSRVDFVDGKGINDANDDVDDADNDDGDGDVAIVFDTDWFILNIVSEIVFLMGYRDAPHPNS